MSRFRILVFCRAPVPGRVKTRLVPLLGESGAANLHKTLATDLINTAIEVAPGAVELWCEPSTAHAFFHGFDCDRRHQQGGDLGERMAFAFADCLGQRADKAILVGTDCPNLDAAYLNEALAALDDHDAVLGPAEDGGYGLIGLTRAQDAVFEGISWGTGTVCAETCRALNRANFYWRLMGLLWDVDRPMDVRRYRQFAGTRPG